MPSTHWLYPTNPRRGCWVGRDRADVLVPGNVRAREREDADGTVTWSLNSGYRTMRPGDLVWLYAAGHQAVYALARAQEIAYDARADSWVVVSRWCHSATERLERAPIPRTAFGQVPQSVQRANPRTVTVLEQWLTGGAAATPLGSTLVMGQIEPQTVPSVRSSLPHLHQRRPLGNARRRIPWPFLI